MKNATRQEKIGITYLNELCTRSPYLDPNIYYNDKTQAIDGQIFVYQKNMPLNKKGFLKEYLEKYVTIQAKTKEMHLPTNKNIITFSADIKDLKIYFKNGGILFFLMLIDENNLDNKEIFYSKLTEVNLESILEKKDQQTKASITCFKLREDSLERVIRTYIASSEKQCLNIVPTIKSINELKDISFIDLRCGCVGDKKVSFEGYVRKNDATCTIVPLSNTLTEEIVNSLSHKKYNSNITLKNKFHYNIQGVVDLLSIPNNDTELKLSQNLIFTINTNNNNNRVSFIPIGNINSILYDLNFLTSVKEEGFLEINGTQIEINFDLQFIEYINNLQTYFSFASAILNCNEYYKKYMEINLSKINKKILDMIDNMFYQEQNNTKNNINQLITVNLPQKKVGYIIKEVSENQKINYYTFLDYLNTETNGFLLLDNNKKTKVQHFFFLFHFLNGMSTIPPALLKLTQTDFNLLLQNIKKYNKINKTQIKIYNDILTDTLYLLENNTTKQKDNLHAFLLDLSSYLATLNKKN